MLTKIVNGVEIQLSADEEGAVRAAWAIDDVARAKYQTTKGYINNRNAAYPSIQDQLLAIWNSMDSGEIPMSKTFYSTIKSINDKYPAPV